jgi:hypothetical protein
MFYSTTVLETGQKHFPRRLGRAPSYAYVFIRERGTPRPDRWLPKWAIQVAFCHARAAMYANRRRIRGRRGRRLLRRRGEYLERTFAHTYNTGGLRRTHLRGHSNILKRVLIHVGGFNLGLMMRQLIGVGTPRGLVSYPLAAGAEHCE